MDLGEIADELKTYGWKCVDCKSCEVCQDKGDDVRISNFWIKLYFFDKDHTGPHFVL
jgi:hypothetical protein